MVLNVLQTLILGAINGIVEFLPLDSRKILIFILSNFYESDSSVLPALSLFFSIGIFLSIIFYFSKDILNLFEKLFTYRNAGEEDRKTIRFLFFSTIFTGIFSFLILKVIYSPEDVLIFLGKTLTFIFGSLLLFAGIIQLKTRKEWQNRQRNLKRRDGFLIGLMQGLSALPALPRPGITISAFLLKKFDGTTSLKLYFLMSIPVILVSEILFSLNEIAFSTSVFYGLLASFALGILTIHFLMALSRKLSPGWFSILFAAVMLLGILI